MNEARELSPAVEQQLLEQLRDLSEPAGITLWPPAPGWWALAALAIALIGWFAFKRYQHYASRAWRRQSRQIIESAFARWSDDGNAEPYVDESAALLRRVAVHQLGRADSAGLTGERWRDCLNDLSTSPLSDPALNAVTDDRYRSLTPRVDVKALHRELVDWLDGVKEVARV